MTEASAIHPDRTAARAAHSAAATTAPSSAATGTRCAPILDPEREVERVDEREQHGELVGRRALHRRRARGRRARGQRLAADHGGGEQGEGRDHEDAAGEHRLPGEALVAGMDGVHEDRADVDEQRDAEAQPGAADERLPHREATEEDPAHEPGPGIVARGRDGAGHEEEEPAERSDGGGARHGDGRGARAAARPRAILRRARLALLGRRRDDRRAQVIDLAEAVEDRRQPGDDPGHLPRDGGVIVRHQPRAHHGDIGHGGGEGHPAGAAGAGHPRRAAGEQRQHHAEGRQVLAQIAAQAEVEAKRVRHEDRGRAGDGPGLALVLLRLRQGDAVERAEDHDDAHPERDPIGPHARADPRHLIESRAQEAERPEHRPPPLDGEEEQRPVEQQQVAEEADGMILARRERERRDEAPEQPEERDDDGVVPHRQHAARDRDQRHEPERGRAPHQPVERVRGPERGVEDGDAGAPEPVGEDGVPPPEHDLGRGHAAQPDQRAEDDAQRGRDEIVLESST
ncbi:MAG: hypothetical protein QM820_01960 [Minicystis sp.]